MQQSNERWYYSLVEAPSRHFRRLHTRWINKSDSERFGLLEQHARRGLQAAWVQLACHIGRLARRCDYAVVGS